MHLVLYTGYIAREEDKHKKAFSLYLQTETEPPLQSMPIALNPRSGKSVTVRQKTYEQYYKPYSDCVVLEKNNELIGTLADRSIFVMTVANNRTYSQNECFRVCTQILVTQNVGCNSYKIDYQVADKKLCEYYVELDNPMEDTAKNDTLFNEFCLPRCPLECKKSIIKFTVAEYNYDSSYTNKYTQSKNFDDYQGEDSLSTYVYNNLVEVFVSSERSLPHIEIIEEPKITGDDLFAEIGAHLHLFLGMSLMSFVEIIELLVMTIVLQCWRSRPVKRVDAVLPFKERKSELYYFQLFKTIISFRVKLISTFLFFENY